MAAHKSVVACNSGGPVETVKDGLTGFLCDPTRKAFSKDGLTGFLCDPTPKAFSVAMAKLIQEPEMAKRMGKEAREHVADSFSTKTFGPHSNQYLVTIAGRKED